MKYEIKVTTNGKGGLTMVDRFDINNEPNEDECREAINLVAAAAFHLDSKIEDMKMDLPYFKKQFNGQLRSLRKEKGTN